MHTTRPGSERLQLAVQAAARREHQRQVAALREWLGEDHELLQRCAAPEPALPGWHGMLERLPNRTSHAA